MRKIIELVWGAILFIPQILLLAFNLLFSTFIDYWYRQIHKLEEENNKTYMTNLYKKIRFLEEENERLTKNQYLFEEMSNQIQNGKSVLGIHMLSTKRMLYNLQTDDYDLPEKIPFYFTFYKNALDTYFIKGYYAGQIHDYLKERSIDYERMPENYEYTVKVEWRIARGYKGGKSKIYLDHLFTDYKFRELGLATIGLDYLKKIAIEFNADEILGKMDRGIDPQFLVDFYTNRGFEIVNTETNETNGRFRFLLKDSALEQVS